MPGIITVIQTLRNRIDFHPHLHLLVTKAATSTDGEFCQVLAFTDAGLARILAHDVLSLLIGRDPISCLLSPPLRLPECSPIQHLSRSTLI